MLKTTYNMPRLLRRHLLYGLCYFQRWPGNFTQRSYSSKSTPLSPPTETPGPAKSASTNTSKDLKLRNKERLKQAFKEYGASIVAFHVGISIISLGGFYVLVYSGINLVPVLQFLGISSPAIAEKIATGSTFVVAYAVHKVFAPARISITLTALPFIIRYFRSKRP
ncbi:protein FAM210B, mitochondrial isoform X2 [Drosophila ficusphila]|uniref:protein FAM210B, mitochondrial isoform X2 n=1 Tax=Drosophila ficusphila TaxID=30025 RepID=UPI001C893A0A|nr:protein FAM210B, mitochondrial isoform X2 [Drosophila ficusphila]